MFQRERFEVQSVGRIIVGRNCLRVAIQHDGLEAHFGKCEGGLATTVVELDTLADAVGPAAQDEDLFPVGGTCFVFHGVIGIQVRCLRFEFGCTRIHALEGGENTQGFAQFSDR